MTNNLATAIASLKSLIVTSETSLKTLCDDLITQVGDEGETFSTDLGSVQVTQRTVDRTGDTFAYSFDRDKFLELDKRTQNKLARLGVVTLNPTVTKGQAPKVVVRLSK